MAVLAFDTCLDHISVALRRMDAHGAWTLTAAEEARTVGHAERLMPMIAEVLAQAEADFTAVQRIAVTLGPGTFTGVRTGIAAARAFRLAAGVDVVGTTSLALIAQRALAAGEAGPVLAAVDARRGRLYVQAFGRDALEPLGEPCEVTPEEGAQLARSAGCRIAVGSGAAALVTAAAEAGLELSPGPADCAPRAADLAVLAERLQPLSDVAPIYIRPPDAKPQTAKSLARVP